MIQIAEVEGTAAARRGRDPVLDERSIPTVRARFLRSRQNHIHSAAGSEYRLASWQDHTRRVCHLH